MTKENTKNYFGLHSGVAKEVLLEGLNSAIEKLLQNKQVENPRAGFELEHRDGRKVEVIATFEARFK